MQIYLLLMSLRDVGKQKNQGIRITGMLGIFKLAKEKNYIPAVAPYLNKLRLTNFKLSHELYNTVLQDVGEMPKRNKV